MDDKKPWQSLTLWASLITTVVGFFPPAQAIVAANPAVVTTILSIIFGALRVRTDSGISMKKVESKSE